MPGKKKCWCDCGGDGECCTDFSWTFRTQCGSAEFIFSDGTYNGGFITPYVEASGQPNRFVIGMTPQQVLDIVEEDGLSEFLLFGPINSLTSGPNVTGAGAIPDISRGPDSTRYPARLASESAAPTDGLQITRLVTDGGQTVTHTWNISFTVQASELGDPYGALASIFIPGSIEIRFGVGESLNRDTGEYTVGGGLSSGPFRIGGASAEPGPFVGSITCSAQGSSTTTTTLDSRGQARITHVRSEMSGAINGMAIDVPDDEQVGVSFLTRCQGGANSSPGTIVVTPNNSDSEVSGLSGESAVSFSGSVVLGNEIPKVISCKYYTVRLTTASGTNQVLGDTIYVDESGAGEGFDTQFGSAYHMTLTERRGQTPRLSGVVLRGGSQSSIDEEIVDDYLDLFPNAQIRGPFYDCQPEGFRAAFCDCVEPDLCYVTGGGHRVIISPQVTFPASVNFGDSRFLGRTMDNVLIEDDSFGTVWTNGSTEVTRVPCCELACSPFEYDFATIRTPFIGNTVTGSGQSTALAVTQNQGFISLALVSGYDYTGMVQADRVSSDGSQSATIDTGGIFSLRTRFERVPDSSPPEWAFVNGASGVSGGNNRPISGVFENLTLQQATQVRFEYDGCTQIRTTTTQITGSITGALGTTTFTNSGTHVQRFNLPTNTTSNHPQLPTDGVAKRRNISASSALGSVRATPGSSSSVEVSVTPVIGDFQRSEPVCGGEEGPDEPTPDPTPTPNPEDPPSGGPDGDPPDDGGEDPPEGGPDDPGGGPDPEPEDPTGGGPDDGGGDPPDGGGDGGEDPEPEPEDPPEMGWECSTEFANQCFEVEATDDTFASESDCLAVCDPIVYACTDIDGDDNACREGRTSELGPPGTEGGNPNVYATQAECLQSGCGSGGGGGTCYEATLGGSTFAFRIPEGETSASDTQFVGSICGVEIDQQVTTTLSYNLDGILVLGMDSVIINDESYGGPGRIVNGQPVVDFVNNDQRDFLCYAPVTITEVGCTATTPATSSVTTSGPSELPGTELKAIFARLGAAPCARCAATAAKMDHWGPDKCEARIDELVAEIKSNIRRLSWWKKLQAAPVAAKALRQGITIESCLKEAIAASRV